ncbi:MAG TPA: multiheme c-type cytochrome [Gemmataceae bacterium]|nr:multiheme c-type cytochrome [Gemmataceae bacterium]
MTEPTNQDGTVGEAGKPAVGKTPSNRRRRLFQLAALGLIVVSGLAGTGLAWLLRPPDASDDKDPKPTGPLAPYFKDWDKPEVAIVLTADQHGYLSPCGCSEPQQGGLERRYNLIQLLKNRGWPVVAVDLGNVPQVEAPAKLPNKQGLIKYRYAMRAMKEMGYIAVGIGDFETAMPLTRLLDEYALQEPKPRVVSADLLERDKYPDETQAWQQADPIPGSNLKIGVTAALGPSIYERVQKNNSPVKFGNSRAALTAVLQEMDAAKVDLPILLYMGSVMQKPGGSEAEACAKAFPQFPLIVAMDDSDLARSTPLWLTDPKTGAKTTMLTTLGHKAKAVGVVGVYRTGNADRPFELRYQLVEMSPDFATPAAAVKGHPIHDLMAEYAKELKDQNYLEQYPKAMHPDQVGQDPMPKYVGTQRCAGCHAYAMKVWEGSHHAHAYQTLVDAKLDGNPTPNRQYDAECVVCHTVGFEYVSGFQSDKKTLKLENVGCESCHGPGSRHYNAPDDPVFQAQMNPWKAKPDEKPEEKKARLQRIDDMCQRCHDSENDVHWTNGGFERNWPQVEHKTP